MGYRLSRPGAGELFRKWARQYDVFGPKRMEGEGCFSDTDVIRYGKVSSLDEIVWDQRSDYSFKEALLAINETLFYFIEDTATVPKGPDKDLLIFLRACDLNGVRRLDQIYLQNGPEDFYYKRIRERAKFVLMGCGQTCETGFCVSMGTNVCDDYDAYIKVDGDRVDLDIRAEELDPYGGDQGREGQAGTGVGSGTAAEAEGVAAAGPEAGGVAAAGSETGGAAATGPETGGAAAAGSEAEGVPGEVPVRMDVSPDFVTENKEKVTLPRNLSNASFTKEIWQEYGSRCIGCGRCNFVCPTCTCFTMQDIFYKDNPKVGERRRVWASCQVDGYTDMAGGHSYRKSQGDRMRFKVMHKIYDFEKRFGYPMCVGCGRCDDVCPEYISYANCINRLAKEESADEK